MAWLWKNTATCQQCKFPGLHAHITIDSNGQPVPLLAEHFVCGRGRHSLHKGDGGRDSLFEVVGVSFSMRVFVEIHLNTRTKLPPPQHRLPSRTLDLTRLLSLMSVHN